MHADNKRRTAEILTNCHHLLDTETPLNEPPINTAENKTRERERSVLERLERETTS